MLISDSLFISLTLFWIACILHILKSEKINYFQVILYALICYAAAKVRYAGLIYPFIGLAVMVFFFRKSYGKLLLNATVSLLVFFFIYRQGVRENKELCGIETFSAFSGWARLNNAAIALPQEGMEIKDKKFAEIHSFFKSFPDSMYNAKKVFTGELIWNKSYPEKMYLQAKLRANPNYPYFFRYVSLGKVYNDYAGYLIKHNFMFFITHFYLPNMLSVIFPSVDDITEYLYRPVDESTQAVCDTKFTKFIPRVDVYKNWFSGWVGFKYTAYTLVFIASLIYFLGFKRLKLPKNYTIVIYFMSIFLICNSLFLAYAHPIVLRYIISNEFLFVTVVLILFDQYSKLKQTDNGLGVKNEDK